MVILVHMWWRGGLARADDDLVEARGDDGGAQAPELGQQLHEDLAHHAVHLRQQCW